MQHTEFRDPNYNLRRAPVSDETSFDGYDFSNFRYNIVVERIHDPVPNMREVLNENVGRHGSMLRSLYMEPREIQLECRMFLAHAQHFGGYLGRGTRKWNEYEAYMQDVMEFLYTQDDRQLILRNHPGQYYMAHLKSLDEGDRDENSAGFTLTFIAPDPLRYEVDERSMVIENNTGTQFWLGGTDEPKVTMTMRNCASDAYVTILKYIQGSGQTEEYEIHPIKSGNVLSFDCVNHIVRADGDVTGITLDSTWPVFAPGKWDFAPMGGTLTVNWRQSYR